MDTYWFKIPNGPILEASRELLAKVRHHHAGMVAMTLNEKRDRGTRMIELRFTPPIDEEAILLLVLTEA